ncbi:MAG: hypothetical protein ACHQIM_07760 [Sphingobacteriales bacterium]
MESNKQKGKRPKIKAILICFVLSALCLQHSYAQTFAEWFSQGKTQIKYLTQQIAALNACETSIRQGYNMLKGEWISIGNFKNGEFGLHQSYYTSLSTVNPQVKSSPDINSITTEQQSIITMLNAIQQVAGLTTDEQSYIKTVAQNIFNECAKDLDKLNSVLKNGTLQMSDDERLKQIRNVQAAMLDKYQFTQSFCNSVRLMSAQRNQDNNETQTLNKLYGIN